MKQADSLAALVLEQPEIFELFHTPGAAGHAFVSIAVDEHRETWRLGSTRFRRYLEQAFFRRHERVPNTVAIREALDVLTGEALFHGPTHRVFSRVALLDGVTYFDLGDEEWRAVAVRPGSWEVLARAPVRFRREHGMQALPEPARGGTVDELRGFVNVSNESDFYLLATWLLAALRPTGPYPVLILHGEQGTAKSTLTRVLRQLADPNEAPLRSEPREPRDVAVASRNAWVLSFDNLSRLPVWLSDVVCRLSTGGAFAVRKNYTDDEEELFDAQRPVILNSIEELATRGDLLSRAILLVLPQIPDTERRTEADFWAAFDAAAPRVLGALFDTIAEADRLLPTIALERLPRMADFARFGCAVERAAGWAAGSFRAAYSGNCRGVHDITLEASPIAAPVRQLVEARGEWRGTATDLLGALRAQHGEEARDREWPKDGARLAGHLRRLAPTLRSVGVSVGFDTKSRPRTLILRPTDAESSGKRASGASEQVNGAALRRSDAPDADLPHPATLPLGAARTDLGGRSGLVSCIACGATEWRRRPDGETVACVGCATVATLDGRPLA